MTRCRSFAAFLFFLACTWSCGAEEQIINLDTAAFPSPDKRHVLKFEFRDDGWYYFNVTSVKTGQRESSAQIELTPVFSVAWTRDSKSVVLVGHVAHGSAATIFHFTEGRWSSKIVFPPDGKDTPNLYRTIYEVNEVEVGDHTVTLTYRISVQTKAGSEDIQEKECIVTLSIDPGTNKVLNSKSTPFE